MKAFAGDIWITFREFLRTFGALQWFFMRLIIYTPAAFPEIRTDSPAGL